MLIIFPFHPLWRAIKKPAGVVAGGLRWFLSLWPFTSGHDSPPAWRSHDGGDRDGGGSASI